MGIEIGNELQNVLEYALEKNGEDGLTEKARDLCIEIEEIRRDLSDEEDKE